MSAAVPALRAFARAAYGLALPDGRVVSLERAAAEVRGALGLRDDADLLRRLEAGDEDAASRFAAALTVGETYFFRHAAHFDLARRLLRAAAARHGGALRVWSAGCATGEEAWSLAIAAWEALGADGFARVAVLATDLNRASLAHARRGVYRRWSFREGYAPDARWFDATGAGWRVRDALRGAVSFEPLNLAQRRHPPGAFDLIFCRNVLLYFSAEAAARAASLLAASLAPEGRLVAGPADPPLDGLCPLEALHAPGGLSYRVAPPTPARAVPLAPAPAPAPRPLVARAPPPAAVSAVEPPTEALDLGHWLRRATERLDRCDPQGASDDVGRALLLDRRAPYAHVLAAMAALGAGDLPSVRRHARNADALLRGAPDAWEVPHAGGETAGSLRWLCAHLSGAGAHA